MKCSIGVFAFNEEKNIAKILDALINQELDVVKIDEIIVVSSGSTDKTDIIINEYHQKYPYIELLAQEDRKGKSSAINLFIQKAKNNLLIIASADIIPAKDIVENLIKPFQDKSIGMTGGRVIPINKKDTFIGFAVNLLWEMHHKMAMFQPKLGEMVAFRKVFYNIPEKSAVDEASIEALITKAGLSTLYVSRAVIYNKGPENVNDFIRQRKRIAIGHLWLKQNQKYSVTSNDMSLLVNIFIKECFIKPRYITWIISVGLLELYCRIIGYVEFYFKNANPYVWETVKSTKYLESIPCLVEERNSSEIIHSVQNDKPSQNDKRYRSTK